MWLIAAALTLAGTAAWAEEEEAEDINAACLECHGTDGMFDVGEEYFVESKSFLESLHGEVDCTSCHIDAVPEEGSDEPHPEELEAVSLDTCESCHYDEVSAYQKSIHGRKRAEGVAAAECASCHNGAHVVASHESAASPVYALNLPRTCAECHNRPIPSDAEESPGANAYRLYVDSIHGRALAHGGLLVAANCSSCHGSHDIQPRTNSDSRVFRTNIPDTCSTCHAGVAEKYRAGSHAKALAKGNLESAVCTDCHSAHSIARVDAEPWKVAVTEECGSCHEESLETYRDTFHGQVTALGFAAVARCSSCHRAHDVLPADDPASSIHPDNLVETCRACHEGANENFVEFSPHANSENPKGFATLYYSARFMEFLLFGVFAFFGLHTVLWLVRSLIERGANRGSRPKAREEKP